MILIAGNILIYTSLSYLQKQKRETKIMIKLTEENRIELVDLIKYNQDTESDLLKLDAVISSIAINLDINISVDNIELLALDIYDLIESRLKGHIEEPTLTKVYSNGVFMGYRNDEGELI